MTTVTALRPVPQPGMATQDYVDVRRQRMLFEKLACEPNGTAIYLEDGVARALALLGILPISFETYPPSNHSVLWYDFGQPPHGHVGVLKRWDDETCLWQPATPSEITDFLSVTPRAKVYHQSENPTKNNTVVVGDIWVDDNRYYLWVPYGDPKTKNYLWREWTVGGVCADELIRALDRTFGNSDWRCHTTTKGEYYESDVEPTGANVGDRWWKPSTKELHVFAAATNKWQPITIDLSGSEIAKRLNTHFGNSLWASYPTADHIVSMLDARLGDDWRERVTGTELVNRINQELESAAWQNACGTGTTSSSGVTYGCEPHNVTGACGTCHGQPSACTCHNPPTIKPENQIVQPRTNGHFVDSEDAPDNPPYGLIWHKPSTNENKLWTPAGWYAFEQNQLYFEQEQAPAEPQADGARWRQPSTGRLFLKSNGAWKDIT